MNLVSIIIPTNKPSSIWKPLLGCIAEQSYPQLEVVLVIDREINSREFDQISQEVHAILDPIGAEVRLITPYNSTFISGQGASYVRNYGAEVASGYYIQYMDDDGLREPDYLHRIVQRYESLGSGLGRDFIISPTIMYRDTGNIQSQGFDRVWWGICRPQPHHATDWKSLLAKNLSPKFKNSFHSTFHLPPSTFHVTCIGAMGLFAPRALFQVIKFDERFKFVYEDLDMTLRAHQAGVPVIVCNDISIVHMEVPRTVAQRSYVGTPHMVYLKSRNRILFVRNNAPRRGKIVFYCVGLPIHLIRFTILIGIYGTQKLTSWWMLAKGTWDGIMIS